MANLTITTCTPVIILDGHSYPFAEAVTEGQYCRPNTNSGRFELGNATTAGELGNGAGMLCNDAAAIGDIGFVIHEGYLDVGDALSSYTADDTIYVSDTDGTLADAAGTTSRVAGYVREVWSNPDGTPDKLLYVNFKGATNG